MTNGSHLAEGTRQQGFAGHYQNVQRIAVATQRLGHKPVIVWIKYRGMKNAVEDKSPQLFVILVFGARVFLYLDVGNQFVWERMLVLSNLVWIHGCSLAIYSIVYFFWLFVHIENRFVGI